MRLSLIQTCSSDSPEANLKALLPMLAEAANAGADLIATPEVTNIVSSSRRRQNEVLYHQAEDPTLAAIRDFAATSGISVLIGSLAIKLEEDSRFANRSYLIGADGGVVAQYDKIHMFRADLPGGEVYDEAKGYRPGARAVVAPLMQAKLGMMVCYDMRFPYLARDLTMAGADILSYPSAFTVPTGKAHWHTLLRARAIENGAFVIAPAQSGRHATTAGAPRASYGHSLVVGPWGDVLLDLGRGTGVGTVDLDLGSVQSARARIPAPLQTHSYEKP